MEKVVMEPMPAFNTNNIPILFSSNDYFVPYMSVMIKSIIENSTAINNYDILILHQDISQKNQECLQLMTAHINNFSIRFIIVSSYIDGLSFYVDNRKYFTVEAYFRLLMPYILKNYSKAIYLDCDMVAQTDIAKLMQIDLKGNMIGAVRDYCGIADGKIPNSDRYDYMHNVLKIINPYDYFISAVLIMDLDKFRSKIPLDELMKLATSYEWKYHDQDVLNIVAYGRSLIIDSRWNVLQSYGFHHLMQKEYYLDWLNSWNNPFIIHFGGIAKPWKYSRIPRSDIFWKYANQTPYRGLIKTRKRKELIKNRKYFIKYIIYMLFPIGSRSNLILKKCVFAVCRLLAISKTLFSTGY